MTAARAPMWQVYACLVPIIGGVGIASLKELSFSWLAVISAMIANQSAALKGVQVPAPPGAPAAVSFAAASAQRAGMRAQQEDGA
jgi:solute carrier family 35 protein E1